MITALSVAMLVSGSLSLFIAVLFFMLWAAIRRLESDDPLGHYAVFAVLAAVNAVFLFSFTALLNAGGNLDLRNAVNRVTIVAASFLVPIAVHFYKSFFRQPGRRLLRVFYGLSTLFALLALPSLPAFLLKQPHPTSAYYTGLVYGWAFKLWGAFIMLLSLYALAVLLRTYRRIARDGLAGRRAVVMLLATNMVWMVTGILDDLTGMQAVDLPPLTWVGSLLVVLAISWILTAHIHTIYRERNRFYKELIRDHLTGAYSRGYADIQLQTAIGELNRKPAPLCLVICDVDRFKQINDSHGHHLGDEVLRQVAAALQKQLRPGDVLARYGGDEFVIILSRIDSAARAGVILERLLSAVRGLRVATGSAPVSVSCSFGVGWVAATASPAAQLAEKLFARADEALYRSKQAGRDRATTLELTAADLAAAPAGNGRRAG